MTTLLGWTYASVDRPAPVDVRLKRTGALAEVHGLRSPSRPTDWLVQAQACFRAFEAFLPHVPGSERMKADAIGERLSSIRSLGQLRLRMAPSDTTPVRPVGSGRAHLQRLRERRAAEHDWHRRARDALDAVASALPVLGRCRAAPGKAATLDLLVPVVLEPELDGRLADAVAAAQRLWSGDAEVTASGLWVPIAFATGVTARHG